jgi:transposase-like protein
MRYVVDHCEADVIQLRKVYRRLRSLTTSHPNLNLITELEGCPICGTVGMLQRNGTRPAKTGIAQRYFCKACKGYPQTQYYNPFGDVSKRREALLR